MHCLALFCFALHCFALLCFGLLCIALHCFAVQCFALLSIAFDNSERQRHFFDNQGAPKAIFLTTKSAKGNFLTISNANTFFGIWGFEARNQAVEAQGTRGGGSSKEPGPVDARPKPPITLGPSKNP